MGRTSRTVVALAVAAALQVPAGAARAQQEETAVSLAALRTRVDYGDTTDLVGHISPPAAGETVSIYTDAGTLLNQFSTDDSGTYSGIILPERNVDIYASYGGAVSPIESILVRPEVDVTLRSVRLFDDAVVRGSVRPAPSSATVEIRLLRNGNQWRTKRVGVSGSSFRARIRVLKPGSYRAKAVVVSDDFLPGRAKSRSRSVRLPRLAEGSRGDHVLLLERRLVELNYHLDGVNRSYDHRTADAVRAFNKVRGAARNGYVDAATWRALADPVRPRPRSSSPRFHIEVDQTRQVLYVVRGGAIRSILHVSTGAGSATRDGVWHVHRKLAGYSGRGLYYPSYFDGLRAIHGWPSVPTYNASHGCVRVPMWSAQWIYGLADIGTEIRIYH